MPDCTKLLRNAAQRRIGELRKQYHDRCTAAGLAFDSPPLAKGRALLQESDPAELTSFPEPPPEPGLWLRCQFSCCSEGLAALALGAPFELRVAADRPRPLQVVELRKMDPSRRLDLLLQRYTCPLNVAGEEEFGEELLMQVMTLDRPRLENSEFNRIHPADLLLRLNFIAVCTVVWGDLRFLDALNFVYERLPISWKPGVEGASLYASWLLLYVRALTRLSCGHVL